MRHTFRVEPARELIVARYIGHTTVQDMKDLAGEIWAHPEYNQNFNGVLDYREAKLEATPDAISGIANYFLNAFEASHGRAAIVTSRPLETALNVLFAQRMERRNVLQVFTTWEAACEFIGVHGLPDPLETGSGDSSRNDAEPAEKKG